MVIRLVFSAIKDGAIMDNIDNAKLVYNMSSGSWNPVGNGTLYWYDGVSYVAYYPYRKNITIDLKRYGREPLLSLTGNEKLQPAKDQSTTEKHIATICWLPPAYLLLTILPE